MLSAASYPIPLENCLLELRQALAQLLRTLMPLISNQYEVVLGKTSNPSEVNPTHVRVADSSFPQDVPTCLSHLSDTIFSWRKCGEQRLATAAQGHHHGLTRHRQPAVSPNLWTVFMFPGLQ